MQILAGGERSVAYRSYIRRGQIERYKSACHKAVIAERSHCIVEFNGGKNRLFGCVAEIVGYDVDAGIRKRICGYFGYRDLRKVCFRKRGAPTEYSDPEFFDACRKSYRRERSATREGVIAYRFKRVSAAVFFGELHRSEFRVAGERVGGDRLYGSGYGELRHVLFYPVKNGLILIIPCSVGEI